MNNMLLNIVYGDFIKVLTKSKWESYKLKGHVLLRDEDEEYMLLFYYLNDNHPLNGYCHKHIEEIKTMLKTDLEILESVDFDRDKFSDIRTKEAHEQLVQALNKLKSVSTN